jgi:hypothetical protein
MNQGGAPCATPETKALFAVVAGAARHVLLQISEPMDSLSGLRKKGAPLPMREKINPSFDEAEDEDADGPPDYHGAIERVVGRIHLEADQAKRHAAFHDSISEKSALLKLQLKVDELQAVVKLALRRLHDVKIAW